MALIGGEIFFSLLACFPLKIVFTQSAEPGKIKHSQGMEHNKKIVIVLSGNSGASPLFWGREGALCRDFFMMKPPLTVTILVLSREQLNLEATRFPHCTPKPPPAPQTTK